MPYCPECRGEFQDWVTECPDCRVPLVGTLPPEPEPENQPSPFDQFDPTTIPRNMPRGMEPVAFYQSALEGQMAAGMIISLGIPAFVVEKPAGYPKAYYFPHMTHGAVMVVVPASRTEETRELLGEEALAPEALSEEEWEISSEEPPAPEVRTMTVICPSCGSTNIRYGGPSIQP